MYGYILTMVNIVMSTANSKTIYYPNRLPGEISELIDKTQKTPTLYFGRFSEGACTTL
jgi:hypothetical protein